MTIKWNVKIVLDGLNVEKLESIIIKDAGFVYESLRNETNRVIWDFCLHETNPRNESFKNESTKRIHDTNL